MSDQPKTERKGISKALKTFFGVGDFGFSFMTNIETYYFQFFLTNVAKFSLPLVTMITTVASVVDALLSWVYGVFLNSIKPPKWGRYRSWLVLAPWLVPFLYAFQFINLGNGIGAAIIVIVATITSHMVWNVPFVANISMINIASKTPEDRMALSSSRALWQSLGRVAYSYVGPAVVLFFSNWLGENYSYGGCAFAFAALMAAGYFAHFVMFKGYEEPGDVEYARLQAEKAQRAAAAASKSEKPKGGLWQALVTNPYLLGLMVSDLAKYVYSFVASGIAVYYFTYVAKDKGLTSMFILISNLLGVIASYSSRKVAAKLSARNTVIYAYLGMVVVLLAAFLLHQNAWAVIILVSLAQFCCTMTNACGPALYADCAIYSEYKTGTNATGMIMGLSNIPLKIGVVSRGILIALALAMAGFDSATTTAENTTVQLERGISMGFTIFPAVAVALGAVIMIFGYRLTRDKMAEYSAELARRNQQN